LTFLLFVLGQKSYLSGKQHKGRIRLTEKRKNRSELPTENARGKKKRLFVLFDFTIH